MEAKDYFKSTAEYFSKYRPQYPNKLIQSIVEDVGINEDSNILDLGCGTGHVSLLIHKYCNRVYALDPEEEMIEVGKRNAEAKRINNIEWIKAGSEDILSYSDKLYGVHLCVMASSFHWMDQSSVLSDLERLVSGNGAVVLINGRNKRIWEPVVSQVIKKYLGDKRRAGSGYYKEPGERFEAVIKRSEFAKIKTIDAGEDYLWTADKIIGFLYSASYCSEYVLGSKKESFEKEVRSVLNKEFGTEVEERIEYSALVCHRSI
jgi:ubiquinone/menaquinone biosynthesis C-methylase UbiE